VVKLLDVLGNVTLPATLLLQHCCFDAVKVYMSYKKLF